ncbi:MAG: FtsW/RodA/SpoVE family cell cycle protein [Ruminiclostridium sp.]|nr:FtsW/RodA/SpoVE family cell cycle protein [Ruminiclostridium sp.]
MKKVFKYISEYWKNLDKALILLCIAMSVFSVFLLYTLDANNISAQVSSRQWRINAIASVIGVAAALVIAGIDYKFIAKLWFIYAPVSLVLVLLLFTSLGRGVEGADDIGWLNLGFIQFQPSELLKIAFILTFALHLSKVGARLNEPLNMLLLCIHGAVPIFIIMRQGDDGSALVFISVFLVMLFAAGISWKYIAAAIVAVPVVVYFAWTKLMQPYQIKRIQILWDTEMQQEEILGIYMQQYLGKKALGSGRITGLGIFGSDKYTYVPEIDTDFIFAYIGMTLGFIGCIVTALMLAVICVKVLSVASGAKDTLGRLICIGVFAVIFSHSVINIGMDLGVLPVIGIPLPFLSAGGTSVIALYAAVGLVMSVYSHRKTEEHMFFTEKSE